MTIRYEKDTAGIVTLTIDMPDQAVNTMNAEFRVALKDAVTRLVEEGDALRGVVVTSGKDTFFAGGDLRELVQVGPDDAAAFFDEVCELTAQLRRLETLGKPVVAAINGSALGGGLEICLACHRRIVLDDARIRLGQPEVSLGLIPGGGAIVRLVRMLGLEKSLPLLVEGKQVGPQDAVSAGIADELAPDATALLAAAHAWIQANPTAVQPWDEKGFRIPGGAPSHPRVAQMLAIAPAMLLKKTHGCYPAPEAILSAAVEGAQVDFHTAQRIETRYFTHIVTGQVAKNMIGTLFFQLNEVKSGASRPTAPARSSVGRVGVLGAGMMGSGIAYACARRGIDVVLKDISLEAAEKGKAYSAALYEKKLDRGRGSAEERDGTLARITPTAELAPLEGCELIIEAVFENRELKAGVTRETEPLLAADGIFASNTSTLPITGLALASGHPEKFIGIHFFSPVDKMKLVEIIVGEKTDDETLARAFDFVRRIGKIPIVVNDSRGFFTSRVFGTYINEAAAMLGEGVSPASIESASLQAGMPTGALAVSDEVSLSLGVHIRDQTKADFEAEGKTWVPHPAEAVLDRMVGQFGRTGKAAGAGFYDYPKDARKRLWPGLYQHFASGDSTVSFDDIRDRLLYIQSIETARCLEEGVLRSVRDGNVGSIFGFGFAPWAGGALQFVNHHGTKRFVARARQLADRYGERFTPPPLLVDLATGGKPL